MALHYIAVASYYSGGTRIAWHYADSDSFDHKLIKNFLMRSKDVLGNVDLGIHKLSTSSTSWESVVEKDSFFKDVLPIKDYEDFLTLLTQDKKLTAVDVAKLLISNMALSNLKLQKLLYLYYTDYLLSTGKKLFDEPIEAWKFGPVVASVYELYKANGAKRINDDKGSKFTVVDGDVPPILAKFVSQPDSLEMFESLKRVITKYGDKTANELVNITHRAHTPWKNVYVPNCNVEITDADIYAAYKHHRDELYGV